MGVHDFKPVKIDDLLKNRVAKLTTEDKFFLTTEKATFTAAGLLFLEQWEEIKDSDTKILNFYDKISTLIKKAQKDKIVFEELKGVKTRSELEELLERLK